MYGLAQSRILAYDQKLPSRIIHLHFGELRVLISAISGHCRTVVILFFSSVNLMLLSQQFGGQKSDPLQSTSCSGNFCFGSLREKKHHSQEVQDKSSHWSSRLCQLGGLLPVSFGPANVSPGVPGREK